MHRFTLLVAVGLFAACGGSSTPPDAGTGMDAGPRDAAPVDAPGSDGSCTTDADGDGHISIACGGDDCDDTDPGRYPGNAEVCDAAGRDEDCNPATLGPDGDGDGFASTGCCNRDAGGILHCGTDCDDTRATVNPSAIESCNGIDDNCNGMIDEGVMMLTCYADADGDSYAAAGAASHMACTCMSGIETVRAPTDAADTDCDDTHASVHPGAIDICDGLDNDCNGHVDDGSGAAYYADCDGDGFGTMGESIVGCTMPATHPTTCATGIWSTSPFDCDDTRTSVHPGATELCDGLDNDCNGLADDHIAPATVASDVSNCGACGHACRRAGCSAGTCTGDYVAVAVGSQIACGLRGGGTVECWGSNRSGATTGVLGTGSASAHVTPPETVVGLSGVTELTIGFAGPCAISGGQAYCWGDSGFSVDTTPTLVGGATHVISGGRGGSGASMLTLANGTTIDDIHDSFPAATLPAAVAELSLWQRSDLFTDEVCARLVDGTVQCGSFGSFAPVAGLTDAVSVSCGRCASTCTCLAARANGAVASWSDSLIASSDTSTDALQVSGGDIRRVGDGRWFIARGGGPVAECVIDDSDQVECGPDDTSGQCGDGTADAACGPVSGS